MKQTKWVFSAFGILFLVSISFMIGRNGLRFAPEKISKKPPLSEKAPGRKPPDQRKLSPIMPLEVRERGFTQDKEAESVSVGATIYNPNKYSAISVDAKINVYNSAGKIVGNTLETIDVIPPEKEAVLGTDLSLANESVKAKKIEIQVKPKSYEEPIESFAINNLKVSHSEIFTTATGEVVNPFYKDLNDVEVFVALEDSKGKIVGGGFTFIEYLPAKSTNGFKVDSVVALPEAKNAKAYATITDETELKSIIEDENE